MLSIQFHQEVSSSQLPIDHHAIIEVIFFSLISFALGTNLGWIRQVLQHIVFMQVAKTKEESLSRLNFINSEDLSRSRDTLLIYGQIEQGSYFTTCIISRLVLSILANW